MSINSIETAVKYSEELDKLFAHKSATGFFADNTFGKKFVGAKTVIVPDIDFQGLANYDRETGFSKGAITVANTPYTMTMDRARSLQIDREDLDETGIANLAGKVLGEYVKQKVVPECDAYVLSKLSQIALSRNNIVEMTAENPYKTLITLINNVRATVGFDEELVAFVNNNVYAALQNSAEVSRMIMPQNFKQGEVNFTVNSINGTAIIPVVNGLMKTEYDFNANEEGGFKAVPYTQDALIIVCPKRAAHLVKKTETMRIFTPEQNTQADAYKFDYRIYYDVFVKKSELDTVWASVSKKIKVSLETNETSVSRGEGRSVIGILEPGLDELLSDGNDLDFQWYYSESADLSSPVKGKGQTTSDLCLSPEETGEAFDRYYFLRITVNGLTTLESSAVHVICR